MSFVCVRVCVLVCLFRYGSVRVSMCAVPLANPNINEQIHTDTRVHTLTRIQFYFYGVSCGVRVSKLD